MLLKNFMLKISFTYKNFYFNLIFNLSNFLKPASYVEFTNVIATVVNAKFQYLSKI